MNDETVFSLQQGTGPLLISMPHVGTHLPADIRPQLSETGLAVDDTDWHIEALYDFSIGLGASYLQPTCSRYVVDLNRPADGANLYPGQNTTGLCPVLQFSGEPVYREGQAPDATEIAARVQAYWRPYHDTLATELARLRSEHGRAVLWEGHSIRGTLPFLFDGALPDLNLGTAAGASCRPQLQQRLAAVLEGQGQYSHVVNGRFKGGYITRHYGDPQGGVDAVQLELAQRTYMDEESFQYLPEKAEKLQSLLRQLLQAALQP